MRAARFIVHGYDMQGAAPGTHLGMPSGACMFVIPFDSTLELSGLTWPRRALTSCVSGLHARAVHIHHDGTQRGVQATLTPTGLQHVFGVPAAALAEGYAQLDDLLPPAAARELLDRVHDAGNPAAGATVLRGWLAEQLGHHDQPHIAPEVEHAWQLLRRHRGQVRIGQLADDVGWTRRHLAARFAATFGLGPKASANVLRFSASQAAIASGTPLADVATTCGYADQAHLTRDWSARSGTTPTRWPLVDPLANVQDTHRARGAR